MTEKPNKAEPHSRKWECGFGHERKAMLLWVFVVIAGLCAGIAAHCAGEVKKANARLRVMQGLWDWATETRIVVRNKLAHENASDVRVMDLWAIFKSGQAFRNAQLMFDNDEFKVYAQGKQVDLGEWEAIRKASEGE